MTHKDKRNNHLVHTALASVDSGSEATLISRRFANSLKAKMHKHHTNLSVGGEFPLESDMVVDLTLSCPRKYSTRQITTKPTLWTRSAKTYKSRTLAKSDEWTSSRENSWQTRSWVNQDKWICCWTLPVTIVVTRLIWPAPLTVN